MKKPSICAVILTYNEEVHISRCIESIYDVVDRIYVMDSYSNDSTMEIISKYSKVEVRQNKFLNYASQFNFALDSFSISSDWIIRIDADEYVSDELKLFLKNDILHVPENVNGICFNRLMTFMGKLLRYGGMSSYWALRMWRNGYGRCEQSWMDEHIILSSGSLAKAKGMLVDDNLNNLSWWAHKHVDYSTREAIDVIQREFNQQDNIIKSNFFGSKSERVRFFKNIYNRLPLFIRPFIYFLYRYILLFGFLDGKQGFLWSILQGFWYRTMVDAKVLEIKSLTGKDKNIKEVVKSRYGYEI